MKLQLKQDKGTAGLTILLSLIVIMFMIGLIVMIFTIMGDKLATATYDVSSGTIANTSTGKAMNTSTTYVISTTRDCLASLTSVKTVNGTSCANMYSLSGCVITPYANASTGVCNNSVWYVNGAYSYSGDNAGTRAINDTVGGIAGVTTWFPLFIVIGAMVVLILLTVIIITAIRQSGMVGMAGHNSKVGTA